jgi:antitoxin ParD1/3/4
MTEADQHARARPQQEELRAAIAAGLASGPGKSADIVFDRLEAKYRRQAGNRAAQPPPNTSSRS